MMIYLVCSIIPLVIGLVFPSINQRNDRKIGYLFCVFTVLFLILGLRGEHVGIDTADYSRYYGYLEYRDDFMSIVNSAPLYSLISRIFYYFCTDPQIILIAQALITCGATAYFIFVLSRRVEISTFLFVALYFYENAFNGARQMCAAALCLAAIACLARNHRVVAIVLTISALGIHVISIIMIPFVFLAWWQGTKRHFTLLAIFILVFVVAIALALQPLLQVVTILLPGYRKYLELIYDPAYLTEGRNILQGIFFLAINAVDCALIHMHLKQAQDDDDEPCGRNADCAISLVSLFGSLWSVAFFWNAFIGPRIAWFPTLAIVVVIPDAIHRLRCIAARVSSHDQIETNRRFEIAIRVLSTLVLLACLVLQIVQLMGNYSGVIPYSPFWID